MPKNSIGDFFVTIASVIDKASFDTSNRLVDNLGNSFNKLIGSAVNAANTLANTALDTAKMGDSAYKMSEAWGIATDALNLWRATAKIATSDAKSLDSALGKLADVKNGLKFGDGFNAFAEQLAKLGMGYGELDNLDPDKQLEAIINHALTKSNLSKTETAKVLEGLLGTGASQLYLKLSDKGITNVADYQRSEVQPRIFTDSQDFLNLAGFQEEVNKFDQSLDSLTTLLGADIAQKLTPALTGLNNWIGAHGDDLQKAMSALASAIEKVVGKTIDFITDEETQEKLQDTIDAGKDVKDFLGGVKELASAVSSGDEEKKEEALEKIVNAASSAQQRSLGMTDEEYSDYETTSKLIHDYWDKNSGHKLPFATGWNRISYDDLPEDLKKKVDAAGGKGNFAELKDGIMRPDGTVTQVAPDDWVFAARSISDMARAFIPQNYQSVSAPSEYNIVQNFTINGGNDIPQVLRQQAYQGTQDAMLQLMQQSSQRLQLMSGTR